MAKKSGLGERFWAHGYDLSGDVGAIQALGSPRGVLPVTGLNSSAFERVLGLADGIMDFNAYFNDATDQEHDAFKGLPTTDRILLWAAGAAVGDVAAGLLAKQINYDWARGADAALLGSIQGLANAVPLEWLNMLSAGLITHASATSSASKDDAASSANGLVAYLEIDDIATGTLTVTIEHSTNDAAWATLLTFTGVAAGAEPTAQRLTVTGTVNRYLRITTTGVFTTGSFAVAYRRGSAQDHTPL